MSALRTAERERGAPGDGADRLDQDEAQHFPGTLRVGAIGGIDILVHWSWLLVFGLLTWSLGQGLFLDRFGLPDAAAWLAAAATTLVFFVSVLLHELAHSIVARQKGIRVPNITLFIFGGASALSREPRGPGQEFLIAAAGPAVSFVLAGVFMLPGLLAPGALGVTLIYLAVINGALGIFNLLPGLPLDGGRVLRSALWAGNGDYEKSTKIAARAGMGLAVLLAALGCAGVVFGILNSFWFVLIGLFLLVQARASYQAAAPQPA